MTLNAFYVYVSIKKKVQKTNILLLSVIAVLTCYVFMFAAGWKLNPVVGAVYSPEFYAGKD